MFDVIVLGLGGMGSAAAAHLAQRGQRVLGLERFTPAHDHGSSHGQSRVIRQAYFEDPAYVPLLLRAYELWEQAERDADADLLTVSGGLMIGKPQGKTVAGSIASARQHGLAHEILEAAEVRQRFPTLTPAADDIALYEAAAGFVRPEATVTAHLALAERHGATLRFGTPALGWEADASGEGVRVRTAQGVHEAGRLVIAAGAWAPQVLADLGLPLVVERQVQFWFAPQTGAEAFADHPVYIWETADGTQFYGFPAHEGPQAGAKVAFFRMGAECVPDDIDREVAPGEAERMRWYLAPRVPALGGELVKALPCLYTTTPDEHFVLGAHPAHPQVALAAGFSGHGFKFVPVIGEILADLVIHGSTRQPISLFDPVRLGTPIAGPADRSEDEERNHG